MSPGLYYLHTDHLGTATYVTNSNGDTSQFFLNLPFGEMMAEQQVQGEYENPYKFNAKELDEESGLYYYGARYYNPRLSVWYGVDPLAEDYPSWSPYVYTFNNPIRYIDPTGMAPEHIDVTKNEDGTYKVVDIFYQLHRELFVNGKPILDGNINDFVAVIVNSFVDKNGQELSPETIKTVITPSKSHKRPKPHKRIDIDKLL
ncbi:RHS repeat domain-containing protein [Chryseobacterium lacus]|uniref:RHS repeat domain-containing protein n=1 Tax=Chryseobacterium lacus TaxID=2058346 RepID=UPI000F86CF70|nr:RHS repeat-associated core domain-containing protein [Chryseobacterium lacus]RST26319.1 hypothetical protein EIZ46_06690 [Chryseobacterium lacus]